MSDSREMQMAGRCFLAFGLVVMAILLVSVWCHGHKTATDQIEHKYQKHYEQRLEALVAGNTGAP